tara:strand:- start:19116 stop:19334 length:219 start_codon:yes stop_codon:yes gene_type:complete
MPYVRQYGNNIIYDSTNLDLRIRLYTQGNTKAEHAFAIPLKIEEKSDIKLTASVSVNDADISGGFELILIDN